MKKILIFSVSFLVLLICVFFGARHWLDTRLSPAYIADLTRKALGQPVKIADEPKISFFPLALSLRSVHFDYNHNNLKFAIAVEDCYIKLAILPLLNGNVEIEEIFLEKPLVESAYFEDKEQSKSEASGLKPGVPDNNGQISAQNSYGQPSSQNNTNTRSAQASIPVKRLIAKNGNLVLNNDENKINLENINFTADNLDAKNTWNIKSDFGLQIFSIIDKSAPRRIVDGNLAFKTNFHYYQPTLTFRQTQITFTPKSGDPIFTPLSVAFDGALNYSLQEFNIGNANITVPQGSINISGKGTSRTFSGHATAELSLPALLALAGINPVPIQNHYIFMDGQLELDNKNFSYNDITVKCGGADGSGRLAGIFAQNGDSVNINANLALGDINLNKFLKENADSVSQSATSIISQTEKNQSGNIIKTEKNSVNRQEGLPAINYNIDCKIKSISWGRILTENLDFNIVGKENVIVLNNLTFEWAKGNVNANGEADFAHWHYKLDLTGENLILANILRQFGENDIKGGLTNFSGHLQANGNNWNELPKTVAGNLQINCKNTKIPALEELARMLPIPGGSKFDFPYIVSNLDIQCAAAKGIAACKPVSFTAGSLTGSGNGIINLPDNWIDGNLTLSTLGINLPVNFRGKFNDLSWSMGSGFFDEIRKLIP